MLHRLRRLGALSVHIDARPVEGSRNSEHPGVVFGALAACAGQTHWPLVGTAVANNKVVVLGFRAMTVDAAGCGAVDEIAALSPTTLSGPFQLHNDRNNFSNTNTLTPAPCVPVPSLAAQAAPAVAGQKDTAGNSTQ